MVRTCAINMDIAAYARAQNEMINADQQRAAAAMAAHEAAMAEFRASRNVWEKQVQQQKDDYSASYAQWEADVAACNGGDRSECAPEL
tara:strand:+ start:553 stop:816 length:264 start_codon:yes stop_codon:yes gene_type:complete